MSNIKIVVNNAPYILFANGAHAFPKIVIGRDCEFSGTVSNATVGATKGGFVQFASGSTLSGTVTGKRYQATFGGYILTGGRGTNAIPGTEAGTVDASSTYV